MNESGFGPILSAQPWRLLCSLHTETPQDAEVALRAGERLDGKAHSTLRYKLHNTLLPELAADGLVEFVSAEETVWRGPRFATIRPLLERPEEQLQGLDAGPFAYDDSSDTVRYDPDVPIEQLMTALADGHGTPW